MSCPPVSYPINIYSNTAAGWSTTEGPVIKCMDSWELQLRVRHIKRSLELLTETDRWSLHWVKAEPTLWGWQTIGHTLEPVSFLKLSFTPAQGCPVLFCSLYRLACELRRLSERGDREGGVRGVGGSKREGIKRGNLWAGTLQLIQLKAVSPLPDQFNQTARFINSWNQQIYWLI